MTNGKSDKKSVLSTGEEDVDFLAVFPEIYREEGSFLQRYLLIFSDIYNEMQQEIRNAHKMLFIEEATEERLLFFAEWLGFHCERGLFDEKELRRLVQQLCYLNSIKGTQEALIRIADILEQGPACVQEVEKGDVLLFLPCQWSQEKDKKLRMMLAGFLPAGVSCTLQYRGSPVHMGSSACLDGGAAVHETPAARLDGGGYLGGSKIRNNLE